jgi:hypothetical protein
LRKANAVAVEGLNADQRDVFPAPGGPAIQTDDPLARAIQLKKQALAIEDAERLGPRECGQADGRCGDVASL